MSFDEHQSGRQLPDLHSKNQRRSTTAAPDDATTHRRQSTQPAASPLSTDFLAPSTPAGNRRNWLYGLSCLSFGFGVVMLASLPKTIRTPGEPVALVVVFGALFAVTGLVCMKFSREAPIRPGRWIAFALLAAIVFAASFTTPIRPDDATTAAPASESPASESPAPAPQSPLFSPSAPYSEKDEEEITPQDRLFLTYLARNSVWYVSHGERWAVRVAKVACSSFDDGASGIVVGFAIAVQLENDTDSAVTFVRGAVETYCPRHRNKLDEL